MSSLGSLKTGFSSARRGRIGQQLLACRSAGEGRCSSDGISLASVYMSVADRHVFV
jgi:hypothetical protein